MKRFMKVLGIIVVICVMFLLLCYVNHRTQSKKEEELLKPLGKMGSGESKPNERLYRRRRRQNSGVFVWWRHMFPNFRF